MQNKKIISKATDYMPLLHPKLIGQHSPGQWAQKSCALRVRQWTNFRKKGNREATYCILSVIYLFSLQLQKQTAKSLFTWIFRIFQGLWKKTSINNPLHSRLIYYVFLGSIAKDFNWMALSLQGGSASAVFVKADLTIPHYFEKCSTAAGLSGKVSLTTWYNTYRQFCHTVMFLHFDFVVEEELG